MEYTITCKDCKEKFETGIKRHDAFSKMADHIRGNSCVDVEINLI